MMIFLQRMSNLTKKLFLPRFFVVPVRLDSMDGFFYPISIYKRVIVGVCVVQLLADQIVCEQSEPQSPAVQFTIKKMKQSAKYSPCSQLYEVE